MSMQKLYTGIKHLNIRLLFADSFLNYPNNNLALMAVENTQKTTDFRLKKIKREHSPFYLFYRTGSGELYPGFTQTCFRFNTRRFSDSLSGEFLPAIASARGAQRSRDLRVIPRTFNSR